MISNKYINAIIATITAIAIFFTSLFYVKSKNITIDNTTTSSSNFTYVNTVFNKEQVIEIDIEVDEDNWNYLLENATNEEYINANITVNGTKYNNVGIRAKGNSSLSTVASDDTTDRYSFKVKFDEYVDGQTLDGLSKIALNNIISDATYMKEYLSYDLLDRMGVPTPAFAFTNITLNGEEWGLYFAVEVIEEEFIERNYGSLAGNLYKPEGNEMGGNKDNNDDMKANMNNGDNANPPDMGNMPTGDNANPPDISNMPTEDNSNSTDSNNTNSGDNTNSPNMDNIPTRDNANPPDMGNMPTGDNTNPPDMNNIPNEDTSNSSDTNGADKNDTTNQESQTANNSGFRGGMMGGGGIGSSNGGSLVYTDDNKESYSDIFDNEVFKTTTDSDEEKVIEMIKNLNEGTNLEEYLNVDEILRYFAVNTFLVNLDSYASNMKHNYYLYERDGVFEILPWDYNLSFGGFTIGSASNAINFPIDTPVTDTTGNSPLIEKLLEVDEYKETYHKYLQEIVDYVNDGTYENTINSVNSLISEYVKNDPTAFYTYDEYEASLPELINFGIDRAKSISAQLDGTQPSTSYGNIETTVNLTALGSQGGGGNKGMGMDKDMNMQRPTDNNTNSTTSSNLNENSATQEGQMQNPTDNSTDSTTSASLNENDMPQEGQMQNPNNTDNPQGNNKPQMQQPNNTDNANNNLDIGAENQNNNSIDSNNNTDIAEDQNQNNDQQMNMNNKFQRPDNISEFNNNQVNMKNTLLQFAVYFGVLLIGIIFVLVFKRRKFKV